MASGHSSVPGRDIAAWRELLSLHRPVDEREAESIAAFASWSERLVDPFDEHADPVHVTASAIVVDASVGAARTVLHLHKRLGMWLQPGGHVDAGESPAEAALREAREETGLAAEHPSGGPLFVHLDVHPGPRGHTHLDLRFLLVAPPAEPDPGEGESRLVRWFDADEALGVADDGLRGALRAVGHWRP